MLLFSAALWRLWKAPGRSWQHLQEYLARESAIIYI
jgi:hypothetical protein